MQAVILLTSGISLEQSRMASPVHMYWASEEKAKPGDAERPMAPKAMAQVRASWHVVNGFIWCVPQVAVFRFLGALLAV